MDEFTCMLYRVGTQWQLESGRYDLLVVHSKEEREAALKAGWFTDQYAAKEANEATAPAQAADAPPTRAEMEQKAEQIGLKIDGRWSDKRLLAEIDAKLKEAP